MSVRTEVPEEASSQDLPPTLRERRRAQTRADLLAGVIAVIEAEGLDQLTIDKVSAASGISRGTVYAYFPGGHGELVGAAYAQIGHTVVEATKTRIEATTDWQEEIVAHAATMIDLASNSRIGHFFNVTGPALITSGEPRGIGSGASTTMIAETLNRARSTGQVDGNIPAEALATMLVGAIREAATAVASGTLGAEEAMAAFERVVAGLRRS